MNNLSSMAAHCFHDLSLISYQLGLISHSQFIVRLKLLTSLSDRSSDLTKYILSTYNLPENFQDQKEIEENYNEGNIQSSNEKDDDFLKFYPLKVKGLKNWEFHPYDDDFHPSVPHGHLNGRAHPKLDAFLGWIYDNNLKQIGRIKRRDIVDLWNDDEFRKIARIAIEYYGEKFPKFIWRVNSPKILPKKRYQK